MSFISATELEALNKSDCPRDTPYLIQYVKYGMLSVARHYGGCKFKGKSYTYIPPSDELIRDDVMKWLKRFRKNQLASVEKKTSDIFEVIK